MLGLVRDLCEHATGVVADGNERLLARIAREVPLELHRWKSDVSLDGWQVPQNWRVKKAERFRNPQVWARSNGQWQIPGFLVGVRRWQ